MGVQMESGWHKFEDVSDFNLKHTFECGQCFRWERSAKDSYTGVVLGKVIHVTENQDGILLQGAEKEELDQYFELSRDYQEIKRYLEKDPVMRKAVEFGYGIRILNQDPWETLISFLISQNRSIPLIKKSIEEISYRFGESLGVHNEKEYFSFPGPETLASAEEAELAACRLGYRQRYVRETAEIIAGKPDVLQDLKENGSDEEILAFLKSLPGVGPKVAHCIMLFSMGRHTSFPVDVWIGRVMAAFYGLNEKDHEIIQSFASRNYGKFGGYAQQYLFYYAREKGIGK